MSSFSVTAASTTVYTETTYTFQLGINAALQNGYSIRLILPSDIIYVNYPGLACQINGVSHLCSRLNSTIGTSQHIIYLAINQTFATLSGGVTVAGVYNPVGVGTSGSF